MAREQFEQRPVMLPLIVGQAEIPDFLEDKLYIDLRSDFYAGIVNLVGMIHGLTRYRLSNALSLYKPNCVRDVWKLLNSIGFEPYVVLGEDDFQEMLKNGGRLIRPGYATFESGTLLRSNSVTEHVKALVQELF